MATKNKNKASNILLDDNILLTDTASGGEAGSDYATPGTGVEYKPGLLGALGEKYTIDGVPVSYGQAYNEIKKLGKKYGKIGPGYPSNQITMDWMRNWLANNKEFPEGVVRKTWITTDSVIREKQQGKLGFWLGKLKGS